MAALLACGRGAVLSHCSAGALRADLDRLPPGPGVGKLRTMLELHILVLTDSQLERRLLPISRRAGLGHL